MTFTEWLQSRLVAHGYAIDVDGAFGAQTRKALIAFQKVKKLKQSGVADAATVGALRHNPAKAIAAGAPKAEPKPVEAMPPWMAEMDRRRGLHEGRDNKALSDWLKGGKYLGDPAKLPWCGDAIETAVVKTLPTEIVPTNPFWAQGWASFGVDAGGPKVGAIGVIRWSKTSGHVGIVAGYDAKKRRVLLLGGNQSNMINLTWFAESKFIAFRWPKTFPRKTYPPLTGAAGAGSHAGTR